MQDLSKPDSLISTLLAVGRFSLMMLGIIGIAVEIFRDDGWLSGLLDKAFASPGTLLIIPLVLGGLYLLDKTITNAAGTASRKGDIPLYMMMTIGVFFLYRLITTGSF
ncbi:MAG TPA: hypothetical protein VEA39_03670 [Methylophilaceae bacterium]|nr:hypothetical protein [Methylophilaceae bacterium]